MENNNNNNNNRDASMDEMFRRPQDGAKHNESADNRSGGEESATAKEERTSHYFSYGPYKSGGSQSGTEAQNAVTGEHNHVEVTPPKALRTFPAYRNAEETGSTMGQWQLGQTPKKSSSFRSVFAAFMSGVVVVGALMFGADHYNLFTGPQNAAGSGSGSSSVTAAPAAVSSGVKPTALDLSRPDNISQIVQQSSPAVVKIETLVKSRSSSNRSSNPLFNDPFFRQFFGEDGSSQQQQQQDSGELQPAGMGTGFIFEKSGYILTNEHVIEGADEINVYLEGKAEPYKAKLLGNSYELDLAALKIEGSEDFPTLPIGSADSMKVGDWVVAIGNPAGFDHTVTVGVLSAKERPIDIPDANGTRQYKNLLQTDASINPGNSGGPLLNLNGEVIGINTAVSASAQGIGFAIPTSTISSVLDNLKNNVKIPIPYVGVQMSDIDKEWVAELKLQNTEGAVILQVERRSPAFKAGIRPYDVITDINGTAIKSSKEAQEAIKKLKAGDKITITVMRNGEKVPVEVEIGDRNTQEQSTQQQ